MHLDATSRVSGRPRGVAGMKPRILPPVRLRRASSWSMMPNVVDPIRTVEDGQASDASMSLSAQKRGEMTPHLDAAGQPTTYGSPAIMVRMKRSPLRLQEFHDDLRARSDQNLALAALLGVRDGLRRTARPIHDIAALVGSERARCVCVAITARGGAGSSSAEAGGHERLRRPGLEPLTGPRGHTHTNTKPRTPSLTSTERSRDRGLLAVHLHEWCGDGRY